MTTAELSMAAGLMEGEGTVRINAFTKRNKGALIVSMVNTDFEIIDWVHVRWGGSVKVVAQGGNRREAKMWIIASNQALAFLEEIEPHVITWRMRERIATARWWQKIKGKHWRYRTEDDAEESFSCFHWMRHLNRRGVRT